MSAPERHDEQQEVQPARGFGSAYLRGRVWWVRYYNDGTEHRESTKSEDQRVADRLLKARWKQIGTGRFIGPREEKVLMGELLDALEGEYTRTARRSLNTLKGRLRPLRKAFGHQRAVDIKPKHIDGYMDRRLTEKTKRGTLVTPGTLNRELAALKRAFSLAVEKDMLARAPKITLLPEDNVREGFIEPGQFEVLARALPAPLDDVARFAFMTGWRKEEVLSLTWADVDLPARRLRLRIENSKNKEPRVLVLTDELLALVERRWAARTYRVGEVEALSEWLFHRRGRKVVEFRDRWASACKTANVPDLLFHDLRRSAVRNLEHAGVSQSVAMKITGHKTDSVYRRYRIIDEGDIERALVATQESIRQAPPSNVASLAAAQERR